MMSILDHNKESAYQHAIKQELKEAGIDNPTANDVLLHLFGDYDGWKNSDYTLYKYKRCDRTILQRINGLWIIPCYIILVAPIKWLLTGEAGMKTESKAYKLINKLTNLK
jgi:hypothetical protein